MPARPQTALEKATWTLAFKLKKQREARQFGVREEHWKLLRILSPILKVELKRQRDAIEHGAEEEHETERKHCTCCAQSETHVAARVFRAGRRGWGYGC